MKPKAICLVGHENWGKSKTLYYLVGESCHKAWFKIDDKDVFARHMSNDDKPDNFFDFIAALDTKYKPYVIIALCPNFNREARTKDTLDTLRHKGYELYFWVLQNQYDSAGVVSAEEIATLEKHGEVEVYKEKGEAPIRSKALKAYLSKILKA
jgi:hypothetical protein